MFELFLSELVVEGGRIGECVVIWLLFPLLIDYLAVRRGEAVEQEDGLKGKMASCLFVCLLCLKVIFLRFQLFNILD